MAPYHHIMVHFPIVLLGMAFVLISLRVLTKSDLAIRLDSAALIPCLIIGLIGAVASIVSGLLIWPMEGSLTSTMGRNKILIACWMVTVWSIVLLLRWKSKEQIWNGSSRYLMLGLGTFGAILLATTGTLGGHLLGTPSRFSGLLHQFGWSVYQTYYAPFWVLIVMMAVAASAISIGLLANRIRT